VLRRLLPATVLFALLVPASAQADQGAAVIRDCLNHGRIQGHYSQKAYSQALAEMPADVTEYSDCPNLIRQARLAAASGQGSGGSGGSGAGGGAPSAASFTAAERQALASAGRHGGAAVNLGGQVIRPGVIHANAASALNNLPTPLLVLLIALAAGALAGLGFVGNKRVRARRPH
jgi:hypothetical protein